MIESLEHSVYFGVFLSLGTYAIGLVLKTAIAEGVCKLFHIEEPIAKGTAIGTSAHAMGTSKALEMGEIEGAMSSFRKTALAFESISEYVR